jgi:hypothetical protein
MTAQTSRSAYTAFVGHRRLLTGDRIAVALAVKAAVASGEAAILVFEDATGRQVDFDLRGSEADIRARLSEPEIQEPRGRGRPRLGVTAREVTLLPRHWEWLAAQPGGASATLRRLVDEARKSSAAGDERRRATEAAYRAMSALAGDLPGFEEAARALFAGDLAKTRSFVESWPGDIAAYLGAMIGRSAEDVATPEGEA